MKVKILSLLLLFYFGTAGILKANVYYVNVSKGNDNQPGTKTAPFKTIAKAISITKPGDSVVIVKVNFPIREMITIHNRSGEPGRPVTIDGQNNLFTSAEKLNPADWQQVRPGVYRNDHLLPGLKAGTPTTEATMFRFFMLWNGKMNRMNRSCDGLRTPFVDTARLKPGEWTYVDASTAFYIAIEPGRKLQDYQIEVPMQQNGVSINGTSNHWVIRNINVEHVINDGFNIHERCEDIAFENITATECGDDGISAHEACSITIKGFVSRRNSTGLCHGEYNVTCVADNMILEENYGYNLLLGTGTNTFTNCTISAVVPPGGHGGILLKNEPVKGSPEHLTVNFNACKFPFTGTPASPDKPASFVVMEDVVMNMAKDCKVEGKIKMIPPRKPR